MSARPTEATVAAQPAPGNVFAARVDRYGLRLALVFGSHASGGVCPYYRAGGCHHCDIGAGEGSAFDQATNRARLDWFQRHYADILPKVVHLVLYNSGSVLNAREMPRDLLAEILTTIAALATVRVVSIESREAYITRESVLEAAASLAPHQRCRIILGVETADDHRREQLLGKKMPRAAIERAFAALADAAAVIGRDRIGIDVNLVVAGPGTDPASAIDDAVGTARFAFARAAAHQLPIDLNLHAYYPSARGRARFPEQPRCSLVTLARAVAAVDEVGREMAVDAGLFIGEQDEGHDTDQSRRAAELARASELFDHYNRAQDPALLGPLLAL